jgi:YgiT-type zinc finger domain-containing protein
MKCIKCGADTKKAESHRVFHDKIVIKPVSVQKCQKCGEEYLGEQEYDRIMHKLEEINVEIDAPTMKKIQRLVV